MNIKKFLIFSFLVIFFVTRFTMAMNITLFYSSTCPHCHEEMKFLTNLSEHPNEFNLDKSYNITKYEIHDKSNYDKYVKVINNFNEEQLVPALVVNNKIFIGYSDEIAKEIVQKIKFEEWKEKLNKKTTVPVKKGNNYIEIILGIILGMITFFLIFKIINSK